VLALDMSGGGNGVLKWGLYLHGDYNQDGIVGIADLAPLGQRFGEISPGGLGVPFPADSSGAVLDGSWDGSINIPDVAPIGQNWGRRVAGYRVYRSHEPADVPQVAADGNGAGAELVADVPLGDAIAEAGLRKRFEVALTEDATGWFFWVRPYDGAEEGTPSNSVPPTGADNLPPIAVAQAEPSGGLAPLTVTLNGFNSADLDGLIVKYEWDFDGPLNGEEWQSTGGTPWVEHTYDTPGSYYVGLKVRDNGGAEDTDFVLVKARAANPPVAALSVDQGAGPTVLHVVFDAGASSDPDGPIAKYEWDWNSDGFYDYDSGTERKTGYYFYDTGNHTITVRVTDLDGLTATAQTGVSVTTGAGWAQSIVADGNDLSVNNATFCGPLQVVDAGGKPGVFFICASTSPDDCSLMYCAAQDAGGMLWNAPVRVDPFAAVTGAAVEDYAAMVAGMPAIVYRGYGDKTWYTRAQSANGATWSQPVWTEADMPATQLIELPTGPAFVDQSGHLFKATDPLGSAWIDAGLIGGAVIGFESHYRPTALSLVTGHPGILYTSFSGLWFLRSDDALGSSWSLQPPALTTGSAGYMGYGNKIAIIHGYPATCFTIQSADRAYYVRADDADGVVWRTPIQIALNCAHDGVGLASYDDRPFMIVKDKYTFAVSMITANDTDGGSWGIPIPGVPTYSDQTNGVMSNLGSVNGCPALAYSDLVNTPGGSLYVLKYASYY
jgi:PKD repeat protein